METLLFYLYYDVIEKKDVQLHYNVLQFIHYYSIFFPEEAYADNYKYDS